MGPKPNISLYFLKKFNGTIAVWHLT